MKVVGLLLLLPTAALAKTENWPQLYNDGVLAYKSNDFARAAAAFESATSTQDRALQERAYYNLGNTYYRLGQTAEQAGPAAALPYYQKSQRCYYNALTLSPTDEDAKANQSVVAKKIEELRKQLKEQEISKSGHGLKEDEKGDQKMFKPDPAGKERMESPDGKKNQASADSQQSQEQQKQKDKQRAQQAQQPKSAPPEQKPAVKGAEPENYDKIQATALLNDLRENERNWNFFPEVQMKDLKDSGEPAKDW